MSSMLIAMAGLPATGKSSLAYALSDRLKYPVVAVDSIEAAMWRSGVGGPGRADVPTGVSSFVIAEAIASDVLRLGIGVIVDAVNDSNVARQQWVDLAARKGVALRFIEVICSDPELHRYRLETRVRDLEGYREPTWLDVVNRRYEPFTTPHLTVDSAYPIDPDAVMAAMLNG
ncbi:ATP-binding protein [Pseudoclavibacter endophyticus]|uniref:ATP-binding protein n=2 Tax=Pseudoclavibacter endophyticus TaxID=1778590 RepID=A0A6H9WEL2_9MICO|nr:ATP-binding protein [Pseudoclavibacter endophyticus]